MTPAREAGHAMTAWRDRSSFHSALALIAAALVLGGWAAPPDWSAISREASTIRAACERQHKAGLIPSLSATEHCAGARIAALYARENYPLLDVLNTYLAQREAIASKVDQGITAPEQAYVDLAQARADQDAALQQRGAASALLDPGVFSWAPFACPKQGFVNQLCN
jgi:hypothetical protein